MLNGWRFGVIYLSVALGLGCEAALSQLPDFKPEMPDSSAVTPSNLPAEFSNPIYVLGAGDEINISVYEYEEFTGPRIILPDGTITLPLIGNIRATNLTVDQLAEELTNRLQPWLVNPVVTIGLTKLRPLRINVAGEVQRPGPIQLNSVTATSVTGPLPQLPTVTAALLQAGGVTRNADIRRIVLTRFSSGRNSPPVRINLWEALFNESNFRDIVLRDGDSIFVPKVESIASIDQRLVTQSSIAPKTVRVRIVGEVTRPGEWEVPPNSSISSAVAIAGGPTDKAKLSRVGFVRMREDGRVEEQIIDISNLTDTYQIQEGDVIFVPKTNTATVLDVAGQVANPLNALINFINFFIR